MYGWSIFKESRASAAEVGGHVITLWHLHDGQCFYTAWTPGAHLYSRCLARIKIKRYLGCRHNTSKKSDHFFSSFINASRVKTQKCFRTYFPLFIVLCFIAQLIEYASKLNSFARHRHKWSLFFGENEQGRNADILLCVLLRVVPVAGWSPLGLLKRKQHQHGRAENMLPLLGPDPQVWHILCTINQFNFHYGTFHLFPLICMRGFCWRSLVSPSQLVCVRFGIWGWERHADILFSPCSTAALTRNPGDFWPGDTHTIKDASDTARTLLQSNFRITCVQIACK